MFASQRYPRELDPEHLDAYLAEGWYRMGQSIFTTHFLCFGTDFYSAIWIRLPLQEYRFGKRLAKLVRVNLGRFRCVFGPARIDAEREALYQLYREDFPAPISPSIQNSLMDNESYNLFQTWELAVYDGNRMVALSYFDLGQTSIASILGFYHPGYKVHSLGFFTMLMEIAFGLENGFRYYYPGYVVPGYPRFDYKMRIGQVEYYDLRHTAWKPCPQPFPPIETPIGKMTERLSALSGWLQYKSLKHRFYLYPMFEASLMAFWSNGFLDYPVFLRYHGKPARDKHEILVFDPRAEQYQLLLCSLFGSEPVTYNQHQPWFRDKRYFHDILLTERVVCTFREPEEFPDILHRSGTHL